MVAISLIICMAAARAAAIGSGGILNAVPQARVWIEDATGKRQATGRRVYVHPMEGSLLVLEEGASVAIALDKNKNHAIAMPASAVIVLRDPDRVDVPEKTPYEVLRNPPHFNRTYASVVLNDGSKLVVEVAR
jgi:hypothetical protein